MQESRKFSAEIIEGGRITIPRDIRIDMDLKKGKRVKLILLKDDITRGDTII